MSYQPSQKILDAYAHVMVNFAVKNGKGLKKGETVLLIGFESGKPLYHAIASEITKRGGHIVHQYLSDDPKYHYERDFLTFAGNHQLDHVHEQLLKGKIQDIDHMIYVHSEADVQVLKNVNPKKIMQRNRSYRLWRDLRTAKEVKGEFSWTICNYGTQSMANEAGLTLKQYWNEIIKACFLREQDPIAKWKEVTNFNKKIVKKLDSLCIEKLHIEGPDVDLWITLSPKAAWKSAGGGNIPSFEIFTSPDWRGTHGWIRFNQPLYRYSNKIEGIYLEFKNGKVVTATATKNQKMLQEMIKVKNADKLGEFSLTDKRTSPIRKFMADTLFDENMGGKYGNTHIAVGMSFRDCYKGDPSTLTEKDWEQLGYNTSTVHTDMISTTRRTVTAYLPKNKEKVIYKDGQFTI